MDLSQLFNGVDRALQPAGHLEHVADLERVLAVGLSPRQPAECGLLNAL